MGCSKKSSKREVYCIKKQEKHQIYNLNLHLKQLEKEEGKKPQNYQKEINHKRAERNEKSSNKA